MGQDAVTVLQHEARVLTQIGGICSVPKLLDDFSEEENYYIVEEFLPGDTLRKFAEAAHACSGSGLADHQVLNVAVQLCRILAELHASGIVFRDLSPNNILITDAGKLSLIDFELSAVRSPGDGTWTYYAVGGGTPGISAPEQFHGVQPAPSADRYSLGAIVFYLSTGANPEILLDDPPARNLRR